LSSILVMLCRALVVIKFLLSGVDCAVMLAEAHVD
jgi:hypothetical protein